MSVLIAVVDDDRAVGQALAAGAYAFLQKVLDGEVLLEAITGALTGPGTPSSNPDGDLSAGRIQPAPVVADWLPR